MIRFSKHLISKGPAVSMNPLRVEQWQLIENQHHLFAGPNGRAGFWLRSQINTLLAGSGKSTLMHAIEKCNSGLKIEVVSFSQHGNFVRENGEIVVSRVLGGLKNNEDIIVRFGLYAVWDRPVKVLSTGELRKTMLARALARKPKILLLDKPFDGLDVSFVHFREKCFDVAIRRSPRERPCSH